MDRATVNIAKSQPGFIDFILTPVYDIFVAVFEKSEACVSNMAHNKECWTQLFDEFEALKVENEKEVAQQVATDREMLKEQKEKRLDFIARLKEAPPSMRTDPKDSTIVERRVNNANLPRLSSKSPGSTQISVPDRKSKASPELQEISEK